MSDNILAIAKDNGDRYVFLWDDASIHELMRTLGRYASDPELRFSWCDAAMLSQRARRMEREKIEARF